MDFGRNWDFLVQWILHHIADRRRRRTRRIKRKRKNIRFCITHSTYKGILWVQRTHLNWIPEHKVFKLKWIFIGKAANLTFRFST